MLQINSLHATVNEKTKVFHGSVMFSEKGQNLLGISLEGSVG